MCPNQSYVHWRRHPQHAVCKHGQANRLGCSSPRMASSIMLPSVQNYVSEQELIRYNFTIHRRPRHRLPLNQTHSPAAAAAAASSPGSLLVRYALPTRSPAALASLCTSASTA